MVITMRHVEERHALYGDPCFVVLNQNCESQILQYVHVFSSMAWVENGAILARDAEPMEQEHQ